MTRVSGLCLECNYPLNGLPSERCPECGLAFDPADATTYNPGRPIPVWAAWAAGPISGAVSVVAVAGMLITLWRARLPGEWFVSRKPLLTGWGTLAIVWLAWPAVQRAVLRQYSWPARVVRPMSRGFWIVPLLIALMIVTDAQRIPARIAFRQSVSAVNRLARTAMTSPAGAYDTQRVGLFTAKKIRVLHGGVRFTVQDDDTAFKAGFEYLPSLDPKSKTFATFHYLGDGWWAWREDG